MPMFVFRCECGNQFEKIVVPKHQLSKWCKHCDALTNWEEIKDPHDIYYKELVCSVCLGNQHKPPVQNNAPPVPEARLSERCPVCGKDAEHVLAIDTYGSTATGPNMYCSSLGFRFNYQEP